MSLEVCLGWAYNDGPMNRKQRIVLAVTLLVAAGAGLYPPWHDEVYGYGGPNSHVTRFHFLFGNESNGSVAVLLLFAEWLIILFIGGAISLLTTSPDTLPSQTPPSPVRE